LVTFTKRIQMESEKSSFDITKKDSSCCSTSSPDEVNLGEHWSTVYTDSDITKLGWYEDESTPILDLVRPCNLNSDDAILTVGAGATTLIDSLINLGYSNLIANDISSSALGKIKSRLGEQGDDITWVVDDLINPVELKEITHVKLWIDRAVVHFFTEEKDQDTYFDLLKYKVASKGYVILAEFNLSGAVKCSGLDVKRYDAKILGEKLGTDFKLINSFDHVYTMPNGDDRNYIYTLFQRIN